MEPVSPLAYRVTQVSSTQVRGQAGRVNEFISEGIAGGGGAGFDLTPARTYCCTLPYVLVLSYQFCLFSVSLFSEYVQARSRLFPCVGLCLGRGLGLELTLLATLTARYVSRQTAENPKCARVTCVSFLCLALTNTSNDQPKYYK